MTKHTPGPWECRPSMEYPWDYEISTTTSEDRIEYPGEDKANARLIAAAPELLAALQVMLRNYAAVHDIGDVEMQPAIYQANAAIQKATKEQA